jgi:membrane protein CcdC involved in cytochrome C biogenesis
MGLSLRDEGDDVRMFNPDRNPRRRNSLYVKQNKAYQMLLATLIVVFIIVSAVVINSTISPNSTWKDNILIRMIVERTEARNNR